MAKAVSKKPVKNSAKKKVIEGSGAAVAATTNPRRVKSPTYKSFTLQKRIKPTASVPGGFRIMARAFKILGANWKVFLGIVLIFGVLNVVLVRSFTGGGDFKALKDSADLVVKGDLGQVASGGLLFAYLLGSSGNTASPTAGAFQLIVTLIVSLAIIWSLRHAYAKRTMRIRDGFYEGMYPLVPFLLVLGIIGLQLLPMAAGITVYSVIVGNGIASSAAEKLLWGAVFLTTVILSLYMVASSLFALYMVTLPEMTPLKALRSARKLVAARRFMVIRKIVFLPFALVVLAGMIVIPLIMYATALAPWVFFIMSMVLLPVIHSYMYTLYRELL